MRARHEIREQLYRAGEHNSDELRELQLEVLLDIRDLLQRLQPQTIISADAPVPTVDPNPRPQ